MKKYFTGFSLFLLLMSAVSANAQYSQTYLVLTTAHDTSDHYRHAADTLAAYHGASVMVFSPDSLSSLFSQLAVINPRYVALVMKPIEIHINFIRSFMMLSTQLDSDPFSDFSYGFITGATATDALNFVKGIIQANQQHIENYPLNVGGYAASSLNFVYQSPGDYLSYLNPPSYSCIYMETSDAATGKNFFLANTAYMLNNKVLDIGHNGDPHMLWLFEGGNTNPNPPSWVFDSTKIENPAHARVGLSSFDIAPLNLYPAVAFNGACHAGEPKKVMIEGDIEATFGDTQGLVKFYTMSDTFSFALSILKTGITGYFAPCGANNANDQGEEMYNAFLYDEPLGDIHKRTNDGVVMGFLGNRPELKTFNWNASAYGCDVLNSGTFNPADWSGACYMLGGKANRIYFGDPLFNPFANNHSDSLKITRATLDSVNNSTLDIHLTFKKPDTPYFPVWDKFHFGDTRIYLPVELPAYCGNVTSFAVIDSSAPYHMVIHASEQFFGKNILHIEVDIPDDMYSTINYNISFRINYTPAGIAETGMQQHSFDVYPNPSADIINISEHQFSGKAFSVMVFDSKGMPAAHYKNISHGSLILTKENFSPGLYFYTIYNADATLSQGKFVFL